MVETVTAHYGWTKPEIAHSPSTWGGFLNNDLDSIDALVFANQQGIVPIGAGAFWLGATAPANWLICDGRSLATTGTYAALFAAIGYAFGGSGGNFNLPNLTNRFLLGGGLGATGGEATHALAYGEMPAHGHNAYQDVHNHGAWQDPHNHADAGHVHGVSASQDAHNHTIPSSAGGGFGAAQPPQPMVANQPATTTSTAQPAVHVSIATGFANIDTRQPGVYTDNRQPAVHVDVQGSGTPHNNMPPYVTVNFIVRYQ